MKQAFKQDFLEKNIDKTKKEEKVIAVVVTYNRKELLKECINALLKQDYNNCDILVVDNASTDGTKEYIYNELKNNKVHYVNTGSNLGGAGGFNYGMKEAYKIGCDFMWLMDDDCIVHNNTLTELMKADEKLKGNYGFLSSKVLWKDGSICKMNIPKINIKNKVTDWNVEKQKIILATFVSFFVKTNVVEDVGLPIKEFFIWSDDLEYSRRISLKYNCYLINNSIVTHKSKNNIGSNIAEDSNQNLKRYSYAYRNEMYLYRREGLKGKIYFRLKILLHKYKISKSKNTKQDKIIRKEIIDNALKEGKNFFPKVEYLK